MNYTSEINKEFYKMQIESIANNLLARADDILEDWDKGIRTIHIQADLQPAEVAILKITKEYSPKEVK